MAYGYLMEIRTAIQYSRRRNQLDRRQARTLAIFETIYGKAIFGPSDGRVVWRQMNAQAFRRFDKILGTHPIPVSMMKKGLIKNHDIYR